MAVRKKVLSRKKNYRYAGKTKRCQKSRRKRQKSCKLRRKSRKTRRKSRKSRKSRTSRKSRKARKAQQSKIIHSYKPAVPSLAVPLRSALRKISVTMPYSDAPKINSSRVITSKSSKQFQREILTLLQEMNVECGGGGDCQFNSIGTAIDAQGTTFAQKGFAIRQLLAYIIQTMSDDDFQKLLERYKTEKRNRALEGKAIDKWIVEVHDKPAFIKEILKSGTNYEGDEMSLNLLSKALGIGIYVIDRSRLNRSVLGFNVNKNEFILLMYTGNQQFGHYQALGVKDGGRFAYRFFKNQMHPKVSTLFALIREYMSSRKFQS